MNCVTKFTTTDSAASDTSKLGWVSAALADARAGQNELVALSNLIAQGEGVFRKVLFPSQRLESWKYTNTDVIAKGPFSLAENRAGGVSRSDLIELGVSKQPACSLVFIDGVFDRNLSSQEQHSGLQIKLISQGASDGFGRLEQHLQDPFAALSTALMREGVSVVLDSGAVVKSEIEIVYVSTENANGCVIPTRLFVHAHENSQVTLIERFVSLSEQRSLSLPVIEIVAADGAIVEYYRYQNESAKTCHISNTSVYQGRSGRVSTHLFSFCGALVRNNVHVALAGSGASCVLNGLSVLSATQHVDNSTEVHHQEPSIESRQTFKGIYSDDSHGVFSGKITVDQIAQKTNAFQSNQALLLSPNASVDTKPQLMISADDVKCTHGATVGQLDQEALFYLRSRGISKEVARGLQIQAVAGEVIEGIRPLDFKEQMTAAILKKLDLSAA